MLNELHSLAKSIDTAGIQPDDWHQHYKELPKPRKEAPCFRVWLSSDRSVYGVEELDAKIVEKLRKYGNNQGTSPAFNISPPYRLTNKEQIKHIKQVISGDAQLDLEKVKSFITEENNNKTTKTLEKSCRCLAKTGELHEATKEECLQIKALVDITEKISARDLMLSIEKCALEKLAQHENTATYLKLLFHFGNADKKPDNDTGSLSVILDLHEWEKHGHPIASEHTTRQINKLLMSGPVVDSIATEKHDAFDAPYADVGEKMPEVKLPVLGEVRLRSMFDEIPCQYRYGKAEDASYPISRENRALLKRALEWIADKNKERQTWCKAGDNEIALVYPSKLPTTPQKFAALFASSGENETRSTERFKAIAGELTDSFRGIPPEKHPDNICVFIIKKVDKARSKVVFTQNCSPRWLVQCAEAWQNGCENVPAIDSGQITHETPFPFQIPKVINNVWRMDGGKTVLNRVQPYQGLELLLASTQKGIARHLIPILVSHSLGLVKYIGSRINAKGYPKKPLSDELRDISMLWSTYGLLLSKAGHFKESYMKDAAYSMGQLLKISDELHALYCKVKRDNDVPPQLAGNSMFVAASETPVRALAQIGQRMSPYIAWAKQYRTQNDNNEKGKENWRAGWYMGLYEEVASNLRATLTKQTRFDDFQKAQFFVGYLAKFPKRADGSVSAASEDNHTKEG